MTKGFVGLVPGMAVSAKPNKSPERMSKQRSALQFLVQNDALHLCFQWKCVQKNKMILLLLPRLHLEFSEEVALLQNSCVERGQAASARNLVLQCSLVLLCVHLFETCSENEMVLPRPPNMVSFKMELIILASQLRPRKLKTNGRFRKQSIQKADFQLRNICSKSNVSHDLVDIYILCGRHWRFCFKTTA